LLGGKTQGNITAMTKAAEAVLAEALRLDVDARAELAAEILASLDGPADPDAEAAWATEIQRRVAAIESGTARLEPWDEVKRRIERDILGR
jgi:putative addiction module component (TIGR02574 family)